MDRRAGPIRVLFIAGYMRIGSTLLERLLAELDGIHTIGELRHIWINSFGEDHLCGCGVPFRRCPFWDEVVRRAFGGFDRVRTREMIDLHLSVDRMWFIPHMLSPWQPPRYRARLERYRQVLRRLYRAVHDVSGAGIIIDSTKSASGAFLLSTLPEIELSVLHMVRDSRAVAHSWTRVKQKPDVHWAARTLPRYSPARSAVEWDLMNLGAEAIRTLGRPRAFLRYEDFVRDPRAAVAGIASWLGLGAPPLDFIRPDRAVLGVHHTLSGNPSRFQTGPVDIRPDTEWETAMRPMDRRLVTGLTWPLLLRYGYRPLGEGSPRPAVRIAGRGGSATAISPKSTNGHTRAATR